MTDDLLKGLVPERVATQRQAWLMAKVRNVGAEGFSADPLQITRDQQARWWQENRPSVWAWLFRHPQTNAAVGYGLLRPYGLKVLTTSVAVLPLHAGQGYGRAILRFLVRRSRYPVRAVARATNAAAVRLHSSDEEYWIPLKGPDKKLVYFRAREEVVGIDLRPGER